MWEELILHTSLYLPIVKKHVSAWFTSDRGPEGVQGPWGELEIQNLEKCSGTCT